MKLLQLVNRTILALLVFACFSFASGDKNKKTNYEKQYILITYNPNSIKYPGMTFEVPNDVPDPVREQCLGNLFIFNRKITNHNLLHQDNQEIWEVISKSGHLGRTVGLGDEEDPNKPNPLACKEISFLYINNPEPVSIQPNTPDAFFSN